MEFADRGQHTGGGKGCASGGGRINHCDGVARALGFPGDAQAHYAAANDGYVGA